VESGQATWGEIYTDFLSLQPVITISQPVYDTTGNLQGVLGIDLLLSQIGEFLQSLEIGRSGETFIMERSGSIVATSTSEEPVLKSENLDEVSRLNALDSGLPLISATAKYLLAEFGDFSNIDTPQKLSFVLKGDRQFLQVTPFSDRRGIDWIVVVVIPEADFMEQINANTHTTIMLCLAALGVAIAIGILTSRWVIRPIGRLNTAAKKLAQGEWKQGDSLDVKRSDEVGELAKSFNAMARQLQESFATLEAKNRELQRLDKLKDEFLANTSHELRTPLNGIIGIAESLMEGVTGPLPTSTKSNLSLIVASGKRLSNLINDILDFSQLKHKDIELQLLPVGMGEVAEVVITLSQPLIGNKDLQLINAIPPDLPPANADENRVQQILHNLIGNAIKFSNSGRVEISAATKPDRQLAITVSDTGIGIPANKLDSIFVSFEQADGSTAREYGGTGLGLAVTKKLVELHGGEISVASTVNVGSRFTFTLPMAIDSGERIAHDQPIYSLPAVKQVVANTSEPIDNSPLTIDNSQSEFKIMIVDDEPVNLQVLVNYLSLENYSIVPATNGEEALAVIESECQPDIILLDVMMPRMTGYEVCEKIRERYSLDELPILMLTAKNQVKDLVAGLDAGANDYLNKPIAKNELLARIKTQIELCNLSALRQAEERARQKATELESALQELRRTQAQMIQTEKMSSLGQLVAGVAHEINNPVNFIFGNLSHADEYAQDLINIIELYQQYYPDPVPEIQGEIAERDLEFIKEDLPQIISSMQIGAERIAHIVRSLRNFSRLDESELKVVDIHEGIDSTLVILQSQLQDIKLIEEYGQLPKVKCYAGELNQVFMHILTNAIDAISSAKSQGEKSDWTPTITISTKVTDASSVQIMIADNGPGMSEEVQAKIFDPFFTTKPVGSGTGLGLSTSYSIVVKHHGGKLSCISAPGAGTSFAIEIPHQMK